MQDSPVSSTTKLLSPTTSSGSSVFPWKLHEVLEQAEREGFTDIISWTMGGRAFKVHNQKEFEAKIMTQFFNHTHVSTTSFQWVFYGRLTHPATFRDAQYKSFQRQ
jgi:hypothetical protein